MTPTYLIYKRNFSGEPQPQIVYDYGNVGRQMSAEKKRGEVANFMLPLKGFDKLLTTRDLAKKYPCPERSV